MSLVNLAKIHQITSHTTSPMEVQRLMAAAQRNLKDAHVDAPI
jgi:hypothetical protein